MRDGKRTWFYQVLFFFWCIENMSTDKRHLHAKYLHAKDIDLKRLTFLEKENFF